MVFKERCEPEELKILRILNTRSTLAFDAKKRFYNLLKGFEGEVRFDCLTRELDNDLHILNDLQLEVNQTDFQIDTLLISQNTIFPCEVKNYEGDFFYKSDRLFMMNETGIQNPLDQMKRSQILLGQFLQKAGFKISLQSNVIFINPDFTLYQSPMNQPIIYPTQVKRFLHEINHIPSKLDEQHCKLAELFVNEHKTKSPYNKLPPYQYEHFQKGPTCAKCHSFSLVVGKRLLICNHCKHIENIDSAVIRSVEELKLLFPEKKITTQLVIEWCQGINSKKMIRRILKENFKVIGLRHYTYYE